MQNYCKLLFLFGGLPLIFYISSLFFSEEGSLRLGASGTQLNKSLNDDIHVIPSPFLSHPKLKAKWTASYTKDPFFGNEEEALVFVGDASSSPSWKDLEKHYLRSIRALKWQLIQHLHKNDTCLMIAESPFQRLLTLLISPIERETEKKESPRPLLVKMYTRIADLY